VGRQAMVDNDIGSFVFSRALQLAASTPFW
jgi:hypothetical protein